MGTPQVFDGEFKVKRVLFLVALGCGWFTVNVLRAEPTNLPVTDEARNGDVVINGQALAGSAPITIYDLSYPVRTLLGSGTSMDDNGYFAVIVSPPLITGHEIIAEDKDGNTSLPVVVTAPDPMLDPTQ
jgi:hypothetical protein